jgi:hypothetical protein
VTLETIFSKVIQDDFVIIFTWSPRWFQCQGERTIKSGPRGIKISHESKYLISPTQILTALPSSTISKTSSWLNFIGRCTHAMPNSPKLFQEKRPSLFLWLVLVSSFLLKVSRCYCGVIWFVFMFSNFYKLHFHNKNPCCINKTTMEQITKNRIEN